jgi:hypothetical protein
MPQIDKKRLRKLHRRMKDLAAKGQELFKNGEPLAASHVWNRAYRVALQATSMLRDTELQPERSVMFLSAASLALCCQKPDEALQLIKDGSEKDPPQKIAQEFFDLKHEIKRQLSIIEAANAG